MATTAAHGVHRLGDLYVVEQIDTSTAVQVLLHRFTAHALALRETPLSVIHLENMLRLARAGAVILPTNPGFYYRPTTATQLVDFIVARILDQLDIPHTLLPRWGEGPEPR